VLFRSIRYNFIIFEKSVEYGLLPAIFNIKELEPKHTVLLERIQTLIQTRIPKIFNILENSKNKIDKYKLFHSYYRYGDFFHITTEYLHIMTNTTRYAYTYKNSILLEELIYSCSKITDIGNPFWKELKLEYEMKKYKIEHYIQKVINQIILVSTQLKLFMEETVKVVEELIKI
jgi:hypothetical protein